MVKMWGNSAAVRIPASVMKGTNLRVDAPVDVMEENGRLVIIPVQEEAVSLDAMLAGITPDNVHTEVDFGRAVGDEAL
jgi:antitoxin MazE